MAHDAPQAAGPNKLVVRNIGLLLSGALEKPILDADTIVAENGKITAIGRLKDVDTEGATTVVNANGTTAEMRFSIPELISFLSRHVRLETGDLIATGTPARLSSPPGPDRHLEPGDVVRLESLGDA